MSQPPSRSAPSDGRARRRAFAPGRVNLIGDHTDYMGGVALPLAVQLGTTVEGQVGGDVVELHSTALDSTVQISLADPLADASPGSWGRYVAGVVAELGPAVGFVGEISTTLPVGGGLSSSAALEVSLALALGFDGTPRALAETCQRAEQRASGVPCGLMDQLTSACGVEGHALLLDFTEQSIDPVRVPPEATIVVVHSGEERALAGSAYAERRAQCEQAEELLGPLRRATVDHLAAIDDPVIRRRARHVITENARVIDAASLLAAGRLPDVGDLMAASHRSLRDDFEVSTPRLDALVDRLGSTPGVHGARLTGAGFGGCVVALTDRGALDEGWTVTPSGGARLM